MYICLITRYEISFEYLPDHKISYEYLSDQEMSLKYSFNYEIFENVSLQIWFYSSSILASAGLTSSQISFSTVLFGIDAMIFSAAGVSCLRILSSLSDHKYVFSHRP